MAGQQVPTSRPQTPEMKGPICLPSFSEEKMLSLPCHVSAVFPSLMFVKRLGDQKRHREMRKRSGEEVASRRCEVATVGGQGWDVGGWCSDGIDLAAPPDMRSPERECPAPQIN